MSSLAPTQRGFTTLQQSYDFTSSMATLGPQWGVYNTAYTGNPNLRNPSMITVSNGALHVATQGDVGSGMCLCKNGASPTQPYGRWDVYARADANPDHGFALMLWPNSNNWPSGGEIDIAEYPLPNRTYTTFAVHYGATNQRILRQFPGDFTQYHLYSVEWLPSGIRYFIDGALMCTITTPAAIPTGPMHLAVQAGPIGTSPSNTRASFDVAWIKVYQ